VPEHRAQPYVPPPGRRERVLFQTRHREPGEEAEGEARRAGQPHHRHHHQRRTPHQVRHHTAHARRPPTGQSQLLSLSTDLVARHSRLEPPVVGQN
jgi:hypothetical protein